MDRRSIRYLLRRIKSNEDTSTNPDVDVIDLPELPDGFRESFEKQERFRGWMGFQVTWDVDDSGWTIVFLDKSLEQQWIDLLNEKVPEFPSNNTDFVSDDKEEKPKGKKSKSKVKK